MWKWLMFTLTLEVSAVWLTWASQAPDLLYFLVVFSPWTGGGCVESSSFLTDWVFYRPWGESHVAGRKALTRTKVLMPKPNFIFQEVKWAFPAGKVTKNVLILKVKAKTMKQSKKYTPSYQAAWLQAYRHWPFKGLVHTKKKKLSLITFPHIVPHL